MIAKQNLSNLIHSSTGANANLARYGFTEIMAVPFEVPNAPWSVHIHCCSGSRRLSTNSAIQALLKSESADLA